MTKDNINLKGTCPNCRDVDDQLELKEMLDNFKINIGTDGAEELHYEIRTLHDGDCWTLYKDACYSQLADKNEDDIEIPQFVFQLRDLLFNNK